MFDDPARLIGLIAVLLLSLSWHEAAHAWVADRLGDPTARQLGRVTLNPIKHLHPILSVLLPVLMLVTTGILFGGGKPVPVQPQHFRNPRRDFMLVALAGPASNLALAAGFALAFVLCAWAGVFTGFTIPGLGDGSPDRVFAPTLEGIGDDGVLGHVISMGVFLNVLLAVFNLVPLPPLDGSRVVGWLLPRPVAATWYRLDRLGIVLVLAFFLFLDGYRYVRLALDPTYYAYVDAADQMVKWRGPPS